MANSAKRLYTVKQTAQSYPAFSEGGLRHLIFNAKSNGFAACIRRFGRRVIIDADAFEAWIDNQKVTV